MRAFLAGVVLLISPAVIAQQLNSDLTIRFTAGELPGSGFFSGNIVIELFGSHGLNARGHAQAERFLSELKPTSGHADFELAVAGALTGQWIAATATYQDSLSPVRDDTSELSNSIQVTQ